MYMLSRRYTCSCLPGYEGNPYFGCSDIDECSGSYNLCSNNCTNTYGSYNFSSHKPRIVGDGFKNGTGCTIPEKSNNTGFAVEFSLAMSFGFLICVTCIALIVFFMRRKIMKLREKFFEQNGGIMLKQQLSHYEGNDKSFKIYTSSELRAITDNYSKKRIIGQGGCGIVYKGILKDDTEVAVKTSKIVDQTQIEQFINEVVILTQINHRNVVRLLLGILRK